MGERQGFLRTLLAMLAIFSMIVTAALAFMVVTNLDNLGRATKVVALIKGQALADVSTSQLIEGAAAGMVDALDDPYSEYLEPKRFQDLEGHIKGTYGGVGLLISMEKDHRLVVVSPFKGTPAQRAGIVSGDLIIKIDDQETSEIDLNEAASLMQGEPGTLVVLTVIRPGEAVSKEFKLTREIIEIPTVEGQLLKENSNLAYINITNFTEHTGNELNTIVAGLKQKKFKGAILDLRSNPGGSLQAAVDVASYFIPEGPVVYIVDKRNTQTLMTSANRYLNVPLVVLVNAGSASASEIVAGAIKDTGSGILVGENTFGKGLVQTVFPLDGGAAVKLTTAKYLTPGKNDIHQKGITPDFKVELTPEQEREALINAPNEIKDPQLQKAMEILRKKLND